MIHFNAFSCLAEKGQKRVEEVGAAVAMLPYTFHSFLTLQSVNVNFAEKSLRRDGPMGILVGFPLPNSISPRFCSCVFNQERRGETNIACR